MSAVIPVRGPASPLRSATRSTQFSKTVGALPVALGGGQ